MGAKAMTSKQRTELRGVRYCNRQGTWYMPADIGGYSACSALERRGLVKADATLDPGTGATVIAYWLTAAGEAEVLRLESGQ